MSSKGKLIKFKSFLLMVVFLITACSNDSDDSASSHSNDSSLGVDFTTYYELPDDIPQMTNYVLSTSGLKIHGTFSDDTDNSDTYIFNTGEFPSVNVHVFVNGERQYEDNSVVLLSLDNLVDDGYSRLWGTAHLPTS